MLTNIPSLGASILDAVYQATTADKDHQNPDKPSTKTRLERNIQKHNHIQTLHKHLHAWEAIYEIPPLPTQCIDIELRKVGAKKIHEMSLRAVYFLATWDACRKYRIASKNATKKMSQL